MPVEPCGCVWEAGAGAAWCPEHKPKADKATRIAWKISARTGVSFAQAWSRLWERVIATFVRRMMQDLHKIVP
jgi:carbon monoxide dehydrogenase subunit G